MTPLVVGAVLVAAVTHASWNALAHNIKDQLLAFTLVGFGGALCGLALAFFVPVPAKEAWPALGFSAALHVVYQLLLMRSFRLGDFGQMYPVARGTAPLVVTVLAAVFLQELPDAWQLTGVAVASAGLLAVALWGIRGRSGRAGAVGREASAPRKSPEPVARSGSSQRPASTGSVERPASTGCVEPAACSGSSEGPASTGSAEPAACSGSAEPAARPGPSEGPASSGPSASSPSASSRLPALIAAVATGLAIASYTVVDGAGVRASGSALGYVAWLMMLQSLVIPAYAAASRRGLLLAQLRPLAWRGITAGVLSLAAYGLVLWAQTRAPLAPVAALRESSIIAGAAIGALFFKERFGAPRVAASALMVGGIALMLHGS
ncbi:DMT family transporter [Streptomyces sp. WMMB 322]|uniref:DMT family transporter n=1 Tax=Streptomyces sp. WMMB 322 TaxID=1286821 RepID=UPI0006E2FB99|nr:DMT family transporter [Streptomyces sp. WMMB 322]SCK10314.1 EamA-like transporter family protein [Streptomyces sp. WMMB 322]